MNKIILIFLCFNTQAFAKPIGLKELGQAFLKNNYDIRIEQTKLGIKEGQVTQAKGKFDFNLSYSFSYSDNNTPSSSTLDGSGSAASVESGSQSHSLTLSKDFQTGTTLSIPMSFSKDRSASSYSIFPISHSTSLALSLDQKITGLFGSGYFSKDLDKSSMQAEIEKFKTDEKVAKTFLKFVENYFDVIKSQKNLKIMQLSTENDQKNLDFLEQKFKYGKSSKVELLEAKANLAKTKQRLFNEQMNLFKKSHELKLMAYGEIDKEVEHQFDETLFKPFELLLEKNEEALFSSSLENRPETQKFSQELELAQKAFAHAKVDSFPDVEIGYDMTSKGLADTLEQSSENTLDQKYLTHQYSMTVNFPIMGYAKRGSHKINELKVEQARLKLDQYRYDVRLELRTLLKELKGQKEVIKAMKVSVEAQEEKLKFFQKRFKLGKITIFDLNKILIQREKNVLEYNDSQFKYYKLFSKFLKGQGQLLSVL